MKGDKVQGLNPEHIQGQGDSEKELLQSEEAPARGHTGPGSQAMRGHPGGGRDRPAIRGSCRLRELGSDR